MEARLKENAATDSHITYTTGSSQSSRHAVWGHTIGLSYRGNRKQVNGDAHNQYTGDRKHLPNSVNKTTNYRGLRELHRIVIL